MWGYIPGGAVIGTVRWAGGKGKGRGKARARARARARRNSPPSFMDVVGGISLMLAALLIFTLFF